MCGVRLKNYREIASNILIFQCVHRKKFWPGHIYLKHSKLTVLDSLLRVSMSSLTWAMPFALFALVSFQIGSPDFFSLGHTSDHNPTTYDSHVAGITDMKHYSILVYWDGILLTFCLVWPQICDSPDLYLILGINYCVQNIVYLMGLKSHCQA
jgi:hypothetical protein